MASTCDSEESIATPPPDSDLDDDQIRALLASPTVPPGARGKCGTTASLSVCERKLDVQFISGSAKYGVSRCVVQVFSETRAHRNARRHDSKHNKNHTKKGWLLCPRVILDSGAHRWVQAGHPRYTGASAEEGRGWPDVTSTKTTNDNRRQDSDKRQDKRACNDQVLKNVNSHTVELGFLHVVVFKQRQVESRNVF